MIKKASLPITFLSLGFLSVAIIAAGCGSDSSTPGTGGAGGKGGSTAGVGGKGGAATGGSAVGGKGGSGGSVGGAAGGSSGGAAGGASGGAAGGANGGAAGGKAGAAGGANGGAAGGKAGAAGGANGGAAGGKAGAAGGANGGAAGGKGGAAGGAGGHGGAAGGAGGATASDWPTTTAMCTAVGNPYPMSEIVAPAAFCNYYEEKCSAFYGTDAGEFANKADCMSKYAAYANTSAKRGCADYHLCVAGTSTANATTHCLHPAAGGGNPCGL